MKRGVQLLFRYCFLLLLCYSFNGYGQLQLQDSIWTSVYTADSTAIASKSTTNYKSLYYRSIHVPSYTKTSDEYTLVPLAQDYKSLLEQAQLSESYTVAEIKGTTLADYLKETELLSFPFASELTSKLAEKINVTTNQPQLVGHKGSIYQLIRKNENVLSSGAMLKVVDKDALVSIDTTAYLRSRLLDFLVGNYTREYTTSSWLQTASNGVSVMTPYVDRYTNQYMVFDGTYKFITKLIPSYKHFETYQSRIKNIKKVSKRLIGFDVNVLSPLSYEDWEREVAFIQEQLTGETLQELKMNLPEGMVIESVEELFTTLSDRVRNLEQTALAYYNLVSPNKVVKGTDGNNLIITTRKGKTTQVTVYNEKSGKTNPIAQYEFSNAKTKTVWIYGLKGSDYFEVIGKGAQSPTIALIGGGQSDKYEIQEGNKVKVYDSKDHTYIVDQQGARVRLMNDEYITQYDPEKYKYRRHKLKPRLGANPDDGIFIGITDDYIVQDFERDPFTQNHQVSAAFYFGNFGFDIGYYGEVANVFKGFNGFGSLGYHSPNYSTNFFGFGNETPNFDDNLKLDYNRIRMATFDAKLGLLKKMPAYHVSANLFFESRKIDETEDRFVTSATLFFPEEGFFDRKNYTGLEALYTRHDLEIPFLEELTFVPSLAAKATVNIGEFKKTIVKVDPSIYFQHPVYGDKINIDATLAFAHVFGNDFEFYQAAYLGGGNGLRGFRIQRFTGRSSFNTSTNIKWHVKELESDVLPLQFGLLGGFDVGRVWQDDEESDKFHNSVGAGFWVQTANLLKGQMQAFGSSEGLRFSFNLSIGF